MESYMRILVSALLLLATGPVFSQKLAHMQHPCDEAPDDAVLTVPESMSHLVQVQCTVYGHVITGTSQYAWGYPAQHDDPSYSAYFSAQPLKRDESGKRFLIEQYNKDYFVQIESSHLDQEQAQAAAVLMDANLEKYQGHKFFGDGISTVRSADVLHLVTNVYDEERGRFFEDSFNVYFFESFYSPDESEPESMRIAYSDSLYYRNWSGATLLWLIHLYNASEVEVE